MRITKPELKQLIRICKAAAWGDKKSKTIGSNALLMIVRLEGTLREW